MSQIKDERGVFHVLTAALIVLLVIVAGVAVYNVSNLGHQKDRSPKTTPASSASVSPVAKASSAPTPTPTATPVQSDSQLITAAVKAKDTQGGAVPAHGTQILLRKLQGNYAMVGEGEGFYLLKKSDGNWSVVFEGQNISPSQEASLGFPEGFSSTGTFGDTVLYTY